MEKYIQTGTLTWLREYISGSASGDTVTIKVRRDSDGYWWNFTSLAFAAAAVSGSMTFDADGVWKASFTPSAAGTYSVWLTYGESTTFHALEAVGTPSPASISGAGLVTEAELESYLETALDTTLANTLINAATALMQRECDRVFASATYTNEYHSGDGTRYLWLKHFPVTTLTSLTLYDQYTGADIQTFTAGTDFVLDPDTGKLDACTGYWPTGVRNIRATYTAGFATIPDDLKTLCMDIIAWMQNKKSAAGIASQTIGRYSVTYIGANGGAQAGVTGGLPDDLRARLAAFKRVIW